MFGPKTSQNRTSRTSNTLMFTLDNETVVKSQHGKFQRQTSVLMWKSLLQRQRRWRLLVIETLIGAVLFLIAIFIARPVFLTPLQTEPEPPLTSADILSSLQSKTILGYAPNIEPFNRIMTRAAELLETTMLDAETENGLNLLLYNISRGTQIKKHIIWVIWKSEENNKWRFSIRSTERARYMFTHKYGMEHPNPHLRAGFLAVQVAVSQAIVESVSSIPELKDLKINLVSMPVSPLMQESSVEKALSLILMCFTLAFLPAILETEGLVVWETQTMFKRALRMRNVSFSSMYLSWLVYAYLTALPVCMLGAITIILTFRWIHLVTALVIVLSYVTVMAMVALIMGMFHSKPYIACIWTTLFTLLQTYLAELLVHHEYDSLHVGMSFMLHLVLPPLGLINAFDEFALLTTGPNRTSSGIMYMVASWGLLILIYFGILLLLQRTIGQQRAIGGQVSWSSIIFKKAEDVNRLHHIEKPTRSELGRLQEVDELVAKAITFRDVSKTIMGVRVLNNLTFDIYRGEYTILFAEKIQENLIDTLDDLLTGLTVADHGEIRVQGEHLTASSAPLNQLYMVGYCHRSETLIDDLTVQEHFTLFTAICLWHLGKTDLIEYGHIRYKHLLNECNLRDVRYMRVRDLDVYYRAQLCWALARLLEPRIIIVPDFNDDPTYRAVIIDKIVQFRSYVTIVALFYSSLKLQYADRIFVFDSKLLVFGGTPAYMFFRYGREYQLRLTLRTGGVEEADSKLLLERARAAGATVRAHLGSLLILRLPAIPTANVAALIKDLTENSNKYGITPSINVSVPDFEEVVRRAIKESRAHQFVTFPQSDLDYNRARVALKRLAEPTPWVRRKSSFNTHFKEISGKFIQFHLHHKYLLLLTFIFALVSGMLLGYSFSSVLVRMDSRKTTKSMFEAKKLSVEALAKETILVVCADDSSTAQSIAEAYVMSETKATEKEVELMSYVALSHSEQSFTEYLMTRAIDSPQHYVYVFAYGMDVCSIHHSDELLVQALYSPLHRDSGAAARSLARVYMALIRHYSGQLDATIQVEDDPLSLDLSPWMQGLAQPPLFLQFLLILTISHITLLPSMEHGFIRHTQKHAMNFSPALYWFTLYVCDLLFFWLLVVCMSAMMLATMYVRIPQSLLKSYDLLVLPTTLLLYGVGCVPQAYIFSLGPRAPLNIMSFIIVNMVFGETTIIAKLFYGDALSYALDIMSLSPQFNMAYAYVKIKQIFLYNAECVIFETQRLCLLNTMHKCCERCGILQECFSRKSYFTRNPGILVEVISMFVAAAFFSSILLLLEYKIFHNVWMIISRKLYNKDLREQTLTSGTKKEMSDVNDKEKSLINKRPPVKIDTFGEYLCVSNISKRDEGLYKLRNVYLGLGRGEALGITGLKRHGRLKLCEILSGFKVSSDGRTWIMSKWMMNKDPHQYSRQVSVSCERPTLPPWMKVRNALLLIASLRGIPKQYASTEVENHIEALELIHLADTLIKDIKRNDLTRLHFAAAVIGAPPLIILDEVTAWQKFSVRRAMYNILYLLRKKGHAILTASSNIESHMPVTSRLAFLIDGAIYDVDTIDKIIERYSRKGYTVVVHLKDEVDIHDMFSKYFTSFSVNDVSDVLVNIQIYDANLNWNTLFQKMETLQDENPEVYSYIATAVTIDYIFSSILNNETGLQPATGFFSLKWIEKIISSTPKKVPTKAELDRLEPFQQKFDITSLRDLPWSVIFHSNEAPPPSQERLPNHSNSQLRFRSMNTF